jgi:hypothetical protein
LDARAEFVPSRAPNRPLSAIGPPSSLKTGQWQWRDQQAASLPQRGFGLSFFFSLALALHADEARYAGNASLAGIGGLQRLTLFEGLADDLREEHDEAAEPKPTFAGCHQSGQKMAG